MYYTASGIITPVGVKIPDAVTGVMIPGAV